MSGNTNASYLTRAKDEPQSVLASPNQPSPWASWEELHTWFGKLTMLKRPKNLPSREAGEAREVGRRRMMGKRRVWRAMVVGVGSQGVVWGGCRWLYTPHPRYRYRVFHNRVILAERGGFWGDGSQISIFWYKPMSWHQFSRTTPNFDFCCPFWAFYSQKMA